MSMQAFSVLYPLIRMHCKRAPQPAMDTAILQAVREFCRESRFRQQAVPLDLVPQTQWYALTAPSAQEEVIGVEAVQYNGNSWPCPLSPGEALEMPDEPVTGIPFAFYYEPPNWLVLLRQPAAALTAGVSVQLILQPVRAAYQLDETLTQRYETILAAGALAFLLSTNGSEWSNPALGAAKRAEFERGWGKGQADRATGFKPRHVYTRVHRF